MVIFQYLLWANNNNTVFSCFYLLNVKSESEVRPVEYRLNTLNNSSVALSPVTFAALIPSFSSSATFFSPSILRAVTMIMIPSSLNSSGIQNVRVFPDPVGEMVIQSLCSS